MVDGVNNVNTVDFVIRHVLLNYFDFEVLGFRFASENHLKLVLMTFRYI